MVLESYLVHLMMISAFLSKLVQLMIMLTSNGTKQANSTIYKIITKCAQSEVCEYGNSTKNRVIYAVIYIVSILIMIY